jgi:hypothetical protein
MNNDWKPKEYNKLEDTDYKMEEYVRVPKDEYERLVNIKQFIVDKLDEITKEYQTIVSCHSKDLDYINLCGHQYNSMRQVLEEVLERLG